MNRSTNIIWLLVCAAVGAYAQAQPSKPNPDQPSLVEVVEPLGAEAEPLEVDVEPLEVDVEPLEVPVEPPEVEMHVLAL